MAAKNLNPEEMVAISSAWIDPENDGHKTIVLVPILASSLPIVTEAHQGILPFVKAPQTGRLAEIIALESDIDLRHDAIIRGTFGIFTSAAELAGGDAGARLIALRDTLVPDGPQSMLKSYRAESTQAAELAKALTPEVRAQTDAIVIGVPPDAKTLTAYLDEWIDLGRQLGGLEDEKARIEAAAGEPVPGGASPRARNQWVRVVNSMLANADLVGLDASKKATIFGPFWDAEKRADERVAARARARAEAEKAAAEKAAAEKAAAEKAAAEKAAAEKAAADKGGKGEGSSG